MEVLKAVLREQPLMAAFCRQKWTKGTRDRKRAWLVQQLSEMTE